MDDQGQPREQPPAGDGGKPKIFQNVNGLIAGITGLLVALGGLAATWDKIFPGKKEPVEQAAAAPAASAQPQAAAATASEPEPGDPTLYEGDGVKLEWSGNEWLLTDDDTVYHYEEVFSPDETRILAYDKANNAYLRWPVKGGMAEEGSADKQLWSNYAEIYPPES